MTNKSRVAGFVMVGAAAILGAVAYVNKRHAPPPDPAVKTLFEAAQKGYLPQVKKFIDLGAKIDEVGFRGQTPLITSLVFSNEDVACLLIEKGASVKVRDERGLTPLHYAAANDEVAALKDLEAKGADRNAIGDGYSPLYLARVYHAHRVEAYLKSQGAKDISPSFRRRDPSSRLSKGPS